jgi:hypothetical protein
VPTSFAVSDSGTGTDSIPSISGSWAVSDSGVGSDTQSIAASQTQTDQAHGTDDIETIKALNDGENHLLLLPTGDSFYVLVTQASPGDKAESSSQIAYSLTAKEVLV